MTELMTPALLLATVPVVGAILGLATWRKPEALRVTLLIATMASLASIGWSAGQLPAQAAPLALLSLLPLLAFASLLGQPLHRSNRTAWLLTLVFLGLALGSLASEAHLAWIFRMCLLGLIGLTLLFGPRQARLVAWWGIGTLAVGVMSAAGALAAAPPVAALGAALACAVAFPLPPFHKGYVAALIALPGNLPAFLALALPAVGAHGLLTVLPQLPPSLQEATGWLAAAGSLYGSLRALAQARATSVVTYGGLAFLSIAWWYLAATHSVSSYTIVYVSAVGLATGGLLLASSALRARFGEIGLRALSGLAQPMPRFAVIFSLLALAALGLPPFGVYAGFLGMLLAPSLTWSAGLIVPLVAWLLASWYLFDLVQGLLFGRLATEHRPHEDLRGPELASLAVVLALLTMMGLLPSRLFTLGPTQSQRTVVMEAPKWTR